MKYEKGNLFLRKQNGIFWEAQNNGEAAKKSCPIKICVGGQKFENSVNNLECDLLELGC